MLYFFYSPTRNEQIIYEEIVKSIKICREPKREYEAINNNKVSIGTVKMFMSGSDMRVLIVVEHFPSQLIYIIIQLFLDAVQNLVALIKLRSGWNKMNSTTSKIERNKK